MDLTEAKNIKKRWKEYTEELEKKDDPDNHDGVITYLEPDILECEVKWGLRKHDQHMTNLDSILKSRDITLPKKVHFHSNPKERQCQRMLKLLHNCTHLTG